MKLLCELNYNSYQNLILPFKLKEFLHLYSASECYFLCDFHSSKDVNTMLKILTRIFPDCKYRFIFKNINFYEESIMIIGSLVEQYMLKPTNLIAREKQLYRLLPFFYGFDKYCFSEDIFIKSEQVKIKSNQVCKYDLPFEIIDTEDILKIRSEDDNMKLIYNIMFDNEWGLKDYDFYQNNSLSLKTEFIKFLKNIQKDHKDINIKEVSNDFFTIVNNNLKIIKKF